METKKQLEKELAEVKANLKELEHQNYELTENSRNFDYSIEIYSQTNNELINDIEKLEKSKQTLVESLVEAAENLEKVEREKIKADIESYSLKNENETLNKYVNNFCLLIGIEVVIGLFYLLYYLV